MRKSKINEVKTALFDHIEDNRKQFEQGSVHDTIIEAKIEEMTNRNKEKIMAVNYYKNLEIIGKLVDWLVRVKSLTKYLNMV